jgi:hypothetical protein
MSETAATGFKRTVVVVALAIAALVGIVVLFVLPAETGYDPTGVGEATGLDKIANPDNPEYEAGLKRMETEQVLVAGAPATMPEGVSDVWEAELGPFESVEFKYEIPQGQTMAFKWDAGSPVHYDMHAHPYDGGVDLTESYSIDDASSMEGTYTAPFTGIHGWFWENRSMDNVTLRLEATGGMTHSTVFSQIAQIEREIDGAGPRPEGAAEGHAMQGAE